MLENKMKKMIYTPDRKIEILFEGKYMGYQFYILNLGTHPTAYVEIPYKSKLFGLSYYQIYNLVDIDVHGGLTYSDCTLYLEERNKIKGWFIGWDYTHFGDYFGYEETMPESFRTGGKRWTTKEIFEDVKTAINQINNFDLEVKYGSK